MIARGMEFGVYLACEGLSQSMAGAILRTCPAVGRAGGKVGGVGGGWHSLLLDEGRQIHAMSTIYNGEPAIDFKSGAARKERDEALAAGKLPLLLHQLEEMIAATDRIKYDLTESGFDAWSPGTEYEVSIFWEETARSGRKVKCRGRLDALRGSTIYDLKSTASCVPDDVRRSIVKFDYAIQQAAYTSAVRHELGIDAEFVFGFFESDAPHTTHVVRLSESFREYGRARWQRAVNVWDECTTSGIWPGYGASVMDCPAWALSQEMGEAE